MFEGSGSDLAARGVRAKRWGHLSGRSANVRCFSSSAINQLNAAPPAPCWINHVTVSSTSVFARCASSTENLTVSFRQRQVVLPGDFPDRLVGWFRPALPGIRHTVHHRASRSLVLDDFGQPHQSPIRFRVLHDHPGFAVNRQH
jgi:hypothetical protein